MDAASDDVVYAKRGGLFKERGTELPLQAKSNDSDTDEEAEQIALLRERVHASSSSALAHSRRGSKQSVNSKRRNKSNKSVNKRKERKPNQTSEALELSPIQKMLQREAALAELEDGDLQKLREATGGEMIRRMSSAASTSSSSGASSVASSASADQRNNRNNSNNNNMLLSESDASSVSDVSMSSFASANCPNFTKQQQDRRDRNRKIAAMSKKNKNKHKSVASPTTTPTAPTLMTDGECSDTYSTTSSSTSTSSSSTASQSLRDERQSLLSRIAAAKAMVPEPESQDYKTNKSNNNAKSSEIDKRNPRRHGTAAREGTTAVSRKITKPERIGGVSKSKRVPSVTDVEGDASLLRYLERAVRSVGEQFQFGTMRVLSTDRREEIGIAIAESGIGAQEALTVSDLFEKAVGSCGSNMAFKSRSVGTGEWLAWTWQEYYFDVIKAAKAFIALGVQRWDSVLMAGSSTPEQAIAHFGAIFAGALPTILFPTDGAEVYVDVTVRLGAVMVMVENAQALDKFIAEETLDKLASVEAFVMWGAPPEHTPNSISKFDIPVYHWEEFLALGADVPNIDLEVRLDEQRSGQACSIAVTPGTHGFSSPKLVLLTHDNLTWSAFSFTKGAVDNLGWGETRGGERTLSVLPLANVATLVQDLYVPLTLAGVFERSQIVHFVAPAAGESIVDRMRAVRPTALFANPQVYDVLNDVLLYGSTSGMAVVAADTTNNGSYANSADELFPDNQSVSSRQSMTSVKSKKSVFARSVGRFTGGGARNISSSKSSSSQSGSLAPSVSSGRFSSLLPSRSSSRLNVKSNQPAIQRARSANGMSSTKRMGSGMLQGIAGALSYKNHKDRLGLDYCKLLLSHGGTLPGNILNAFTSHNMHIAEAYGMAETSGLVSMSWPTAFRVGAVGALTDSVELQCINSRTGKRLRAGVEGELVLRGRCVAMGYLDDQCRSDTTISVEGFLRTGDVGSVNKDGYLFLLGRVANRIVLSGNTSRYIFPEPIERVLMSKLPMVQHLVVIGNKTHKHLTVLLTLAQCGVFENDEADHTDTDGNANSTSLSRQSSSSSGGGSGSNRLIRRASSSILLTTPSQRSLQRQASRREQNLAEHAPIPRQAHHQLNSQHHHHPQFKLTERETSSMLAPRACIDGATTLGQAKLNPTYMGRIQDAIDWYNESELCTNELRRIEGFTILDDVFSAEGERPELSASLMVNRPAVQEKYRNTVKQMHLPGFNSLKQSSYFGLNQATMAGKFDTTSGKFAFSTKKSSNKNNARKSGVKQSVSIETRKDLTDIHREEVYTTNRGISKFVFSSEQEQEEE